MIMAWQWAGGEWKQLNSWKGRAVYGGAYNSNYPGLTGASTSERLEIRCVQQPALLTHRALALDGDEEPLFGIRAACSAGAIIE
jgi:hypothetical protein